LSLQIHFQGRVIALPAPKNPFVGAGGLVDHPYKCISRGGWPAPGNEFLGAGSFSVPEKGVFLAARTSHGFSTRS